jgi:hypothetical protein
MGLFAPLAMADDGLPAAPRTPSRQERQRERGQPRIDLVFRFGQCDKENHGWREGPPLTVPGKVPIREGPSPSRHNSFERNKNTA